MSRTYRNTPTKNVGQKKQREAKKNKKNWKIFQDEARNLIAIKIQTGVLI